MTLAQLRNFSLAVSAAGILFMGAALIWASHAVSSAIQLTRIADEVRLSIQELNYLAVETILYYETRPQLQWNKANADLSRKIAEIDGQTEYQDIIEIIKRNSTGARALYSQLIQRHQGSEENTLQQVQARELEARIVSRLLAQFQDMRASVNRLGQHGMERLATAQRRLQLQMIGFIALISIIVFGNWILVNRRVINPVRSLKTGAESVAKGNLSYRTGFASEDEIGVLAQAFDTMTEKVETMLRQLKEEINERAVIEQELRESQEQIRAVTESAIDAIISVDESGRIIHFNQGAKAMFAYTASEAEVLLITDLIPEQYWNRQLTAALNTFPKVKKNSAEGATFEMYGIRKDGSKFPVEVSVASWETGAGNFVTAIVRDITERKKSEEKLKKSMQELEAFSYSVSHDLRAPLRHIDGFVALLKDECESELTETCKEYLNFISESANQMGELIDDLLEFSRVGRADLHMTTFNMGTLVRETRNQLAAEAGGRHVEYQVDELPDVCVDRAMIKQVWVNLFSNALKYTRPRDKAIIKIGHTRRHEEFEFYIQDNGVGFDMKYADQLFGVFQRLHRQEEFEGTGVGLANVQRIILRHGGRIWSEGVVDQGATFYFTLPIHVKDKHASTPTDTPR